MDESLRTSQSFWMNQDLPMLKCCDEIIIVLIGEEGMRLVVESRGCTSEINYAKRWDMPISYVKFNE